jgi:uncharacterized protein
MRRALLPLLFLLIFAASAFAYSFPALTGRVVDAAHILSPTIIDQLDQTLTGYEQSSTNQIVVATIPSLEGGTIEDYGYQLGRSWGIGQKGKDNGAILIVAPHERKVRIEVGYGLEGTLTDAVSNAIIQTVILPDFRSGQMETGVIDGTRAIVAVLGGKADFTPQIVASRKHEPIITDVIFAIFWILFIVWRVGRGFGYGGGFGGSGGFGSGGGFSGGGGSFGGGGASGGW